MTKEKARDLRGVEGAVFHRYAHTHTTNMRYRLLSVDLGSFALAKLTQSDYLSYFRVAHLHANSLGWSTKICQVLFRTSLESFGEEKNEKAAPSPNVYDNYVEKL